MTVQELAEQLGLPWEGEGTTVIQGAASLEEATAGHISFVSAAKMLDKARQSAAGCLVVMLDTELPGRTLLRSRDPRASFAQALALLYPARRFAPGVHATAVVSEKARVHASAYIGPYVVVDDEAEIGAESVVEQGASIGRDVHMGTQCHISPGVRVYEATVLGDRVRVHANAVLGADGFGFAFQNDRYVKFPQVGRVRIGNDVEIGANTCIDRAALGETVIGDGVKLDNLVHIGHNCRIGKHVVVAAQTGFSGGVVVEDYAVIGGQVGIGDKARIESRAVLGSGCGVLTSKIVRAGQPVWGVPARPLPQYLEQLAHLARLPEMAKRVRALEQLLGETHKQKG